MFQPWRLKLKAAEEALKSQRLDDARQILSSPDVREFYPARRLQSVLAGQYLERGRVQALAGDSSAGWRDLQTAVTLGADAAAVAELRGLLVSQVLDEAAAFLQAEEPAAALERLRMLDAHAATPDVRRLKQTAVKLELAAEQARQGELAAAEATIRAALELAPEITRLNELLLRYQSQREMLLELHGELHAAVAKQDWTAAAQVAQRALEFAPGDPLALDVRHRAWSAIGASLPAAAPRPRRGPLQVVPGRVKLNGPGALASVERPSALDESAADRPAAPRFLLWVDGVGGYLVCEGDELVIGQPAPGNRVDLPILADLSRRHAVVRRYSEGYVLEPVKECRLDGRPVAAPVSLRDGCQVELGSGVRLRFRKPHPLSSTAVLEFVSRHRTQPSCDAVVLMADTCVLGPGGQSHVTCRNWSKELVLFRQADGLGARYHGGFEIDGVMVENRAAVTRNSRVVGPDFSLTLEEPGH